MSTPNMQGTSPCGGAEGRCTDVSDSSDPSPPISAYTTTRSGKLTTPHHTTPHHTKPRASDYQNVD
jgi:hypothetical protein